jgi:HAE1 family hydrophobic/amphiphilic exporter-1
VPISSFADVEVSRGPAAIHRIGGARVAQISAETVGGDLGQVLEQVRGEIRAAGLGEDVVAELAGQNEELDVSFGSLRLALVLALFLVYVVMAIQFESLRHPFVILLSVPLGLIGVIGALWVTGTAITVLALIGVVMLAGIVVNNAIVLVDAINRRRRSGQELEPSIVAAGEERLRPILMTTTTTVLALLPMAVGWGAGSELRAPLAITVIGGLLVSTILTLVVIPSLYRIVASESSR